MTPEHSPEIQAKYDRVSALMEAEPDTPEGDELLRLAAELEAYEAEKYGDLA